jgi:hypothetical protein
MDYKHRERDSRHASTPQKSDGVLMKPEAQPVHSLRQAR